MKHPNLIRLALTTAIIAALPQVVWAEEQATAAKPGNAADKPPISCHETAIGAGAAVGLLRLSSAIA